MGKEAAREIARDTQSTSSTTAPQSAGKDTLAGQQPATTDAELIDQIKPYAGESVHDAGGYTFVARADGTFECASAPPDHQESLHQPMTPTVRRKAWLVLGGKLHEKHPEPPAGQTQTAAETKATPPDVKPDVKPIVEPSLLSRASEVVREELGAAASGASNLWSRVVNALGGGDTPAPTTNAQPNASASNAVPSPIESVQQPKALPPAMPVSADIPEHFRSKDSWSKDPLEAALTRTTGDYGPNNTSYKTVAPGLYNAMGSGKADQKEFFCDGLQIWALAASGYNMRAPILAADGKAIKGQKYKHDGETQIPDGTAYTPCLYDLINGDPRAVETVMAAGDLKMGGTFEIHGTGFLTPHEGTELPLAMRGAPGAFVATGLGREVPEVDQRPGDFVQARWPTALTKGGPEAQRGAGHAWIVEDVYAKGAAWFGAPASPKQCSGGELTGWHEDADFIIQPDTDPRLIGICTAIGARRVEANEAGAIENRKLPGVDENGANGKGDGGTQVTGLHSVAEKGEPGTVRFAGRLGSSPWCGKPATQDSAALAAQLGADTPTPLAATPRAEPPNADAAGDVATA